jgi:hypothetical protein
MSERNGDRSCPRSPLTGDMMKSCPRSVAVLMLLLACGAKSAGGVADKFVDRYYVESDQTGALPLTDGVASLRLQDELKLTAEGRRGQSESPARQVRVYYKRLALSGEGAVRKADYQLDIRPQGGGELQREAHLELAQAPDGGWRVVRFSETQPR